MNVINFLKWCYAVAVLYVIETAQRALKQKINEKRTKKNGAWKVWKYFPVVVCSTAFGDHSTVLNYWSAKQKYFLLRHTLKSVDGVYAMNVIMYDLRLH